MSGQTSPITLDRAVEQAIYHNLDLAAERYNVTVPEARRDLASIGQILIPTHEGGQVPLSELAEIRVVNGASIIARRKNQRQITVRTNICGRDQGSFVVEAQERFAQAMNVPAGYSVDWGRPI